MKFVVLTQEVTLNTYIFESDDEDRVREMLESAEYEPESSKGLSEEVVYITKV